jgi:hypothetical protein
MAQISPLTGGLADVIQGLTREAAAWVEEWGGEPEKARAIL